MSKFLATAFIALASLGSFGIASTAFAGGAAPQHNYQDQQALRDIAALHDGDENINQTASRPVQTAGTPVQPAGTPVQSAVVPGVTGWAGSAAACNPAQ